MHVEKSNELLSKPYTKNSGWHESAVEQIKKLGSALARHTGQEESDKIRHLYQGLAVRLAKGNASLFLNRTPAFPAPKIDETSRSPSPSQPHPHPKSHPNHHSQ